jgi:DNA modification methylase
MGATNYQNEIVWKRTSAHSSAKRYGPNRDVILFYSKSETKTWNPQRLGYSEDYLESKYGNEDDHGRFSLGDLTAAGVRHGESGKPWRGIDPNAKGVHWKFGVGRLDELDKEGRIHWPKSGGLPRYKRYLSEVGGIVLQEIWDDIPPINSMAKERLGYPTQKPVALLERIINASSNPGDLVLDPFCGCGTSIDAAEKLGRQWIGIDVTPLAITLIKSRLSEAYPLQIRFLRPSDPEPQSSPANAAKPIFVRVIGEPVMPADAGQLADEDKWHFQLWALGLVGARPVEQKKGADHGIDGKILFRDNPQATKPEQIILQVKGGKTGVKDVRDLRGVLDREKAAMGVLISLQPPTGPMEAEAASAGFYAHKMNEQQYPRLQLRTVKELMEGKGIERPSNVASVDETFKKAPESKKKLGHQKELGI